ncbi:MAG: iron-containing alcohol dehydrogenase [Desulfovibrio sp.]|jgi:alcohol dehydrogenase|nr:iron-containing alcohol dehydrogenase [Desulfovibrio sp.]
MSQSREFRVPPVIRFGAGASREVGQEAKALGCGKALIVTDAFMHSSGACGPVIKALEDAGLETRIYDGVNSEPDLSHISSGLALQRQYASDLIVAVGGGSPLDAGKAISVMITNSGGMENYMGMGKLTRPGLPLIAIPTTAGTGSEATLFTIITDTARDVKMLIGSPFILPRVALVDPELTLAMPKGLTAATGLDALTHGIEAYVSRKSQPMSDVFALSAIRLLGENLRTAWEQPGNYEARSKTMLGALQAGIAFSNASVALVHGMSRPVGAVFHVAHGVSNAALLGEVMEFSISGNPERYADVAAALGLERQAGAEATAKAGAAWVKELIRTLQVPTYSQLGVTREKLDQAAGKMADDAIASGSPANNPRIATRDEIIELYYKVL